MEGAAREVLVGDPPLITAGMAPECKRREPDIAALHEFPHISTGIRRQHHVIQAHVVGPASLRRRRSGTENHVRVVVEPAHHVLPAARTGLIEGIRRHVLDEPAEVPGLAGQGEPGQTPPPPSRPAPLTRVYPPKREPPVPGATGAGPANRPC